MSSRTAVGIVLDTSMLQVVELAAEGERLVLRQAVCERLPSGTFAEGELANAGAVADTLRRLFRTCRLPRRNVCVALGGRPAIARVIEVAETSEAEAEQMLQDRIARYAIYAGREVIWRAAPLEAASANQRAYLAAAAPQDCIRALLPALQRAGIHVAHLEPYDLAIARSLSASMGEDSPPAIMLALHDGAADFLILKGGRPVLVRSIEEGAGDIARRPQAIEDLLVEAKRSVDFCRTRFADAKPRFWLCAGPGLVGESAAMLARLKRELDGTEVDVLPPWPDVEAAKAGADIAGQVWAAIGAAMVGLGRDEAAGLLNLVPPDWAETEHIQRRLATVVASVALAVAASVGLTMLIRLGVGDTLKRAEAASTEVAVNTSAVKAVGELRRQTAAAAAQVKLWQEVRAAVRPYDWAAGLDAIINQIPDGVRVQQVGYLRGNLRLVGEAQSADLLHQLVQRLSHLPCLEEASLERLAHGPTQGSRFHLYTIACRFREPAQRPAQGAQP
jgi:Tfp pilus assembly protein PilN